MKPRRNLTRRRFLKSAAVAAAAVGLYTWRVEPHWLRIDRRIMPIRNLPDEWVGKSLLQASDLHIGPQVDDSYLRRVFETIGELSPDILVYTGDFVSNGTDLKAHAPRVMVTLARGTLGTFGILGNHDYGIDFCDDQVADQVASLAERAGVQILRNERADVSGLKVVGLDDLWSGRFYPEQILPELQADDPSIVLVHNPDAVDEVGWGDYTGWILAGHTHGGQCKPPFLPPPVIPVSNRRYTRGEFDLTGGRRMYINSGVGHLLRVRFNVRPELTLFQLAREA